jgi:membrane protease YdiL (CAAX protease family)
MSKWGGAILEIAWTGLFAVIFTGLVSGVWTGLLVANLSTTPAVPWCVAAMALVLWAAWSFLGGQWGWSATKGARRAHLRAGPLPWPVMGWAVVTGGLGIVALAGFWVVLHRLVVVQTNPLPDFSKYPPLTVVTALAMASISGAVSEEVAFRGYFQGALERRGLGAGAILVSALVMSPEHALTQGFVWPTMLFYLLVDGLLGALAFLTQSIRPVVIVHAIGLFIFFALVWPYDKERTPISVGGADLGFWLSVAQTGVFAVLSLAGFWRLARLRRSGELAA